MRTVAILLRGLGVAAPCQLEQGSLDLASGVREEHMHRRLGAGFPEAQRERCGSPCDSAGHLLLKDGRGAHEE